MRRNPTSDRYATNSTQYCVLFSGGINLNLQGNLQSATKHGNPANFISSYKSASDPKTSLVLGEIENDALVFYYKNCFDLLWEQIILAIKKIFEIRGWRPWICKNFEIKSLKKLLGFRKVHEKLKTLTFFHPKPWQL